MKAWRSHHYEIMILVERVLLLTKFAQPPKPGTLNQSAREVEISMLTCINALAEISASRRLRFVAVTAIRPYEHQSLVVIKRLLISNTNILLNQLLRRAL